MISKEDVKKLAELSLLSVEDKELDALAGEIDAIVAYISEIDSFAGGQEVIEKPLLRNVFREDVVTHKKGEYTERLLREVPVRDGSYVQVKKVL